MKLKKQLRQSHVDDVHPDMEIAGIMIMMMIEYLLFLHQCNILI